MFSSFKSSTTRKVPGDITSLGGQFGRTVYSSPSGSISQTPAADFTDYFFRYVLTPSNPVTFTLGKIENPIAPGYTALIANLSPDNDISVNEFGGSSITTIPSQTSILITARLAGTPDIWDVLVNVPTEINPSGQLEVGKTLFVSSGVSGPGTRLRLDDPFPTLNAANSAALEGDLIVTYNGTYNASGLTHDRFLFFPDTDVTCDSGILFNTTGSSDLLIYGDCNITITGSGSLVNSSSSGNINININNITSSTSSELFTTTNSSSSVKFLLKEEFIDNSTATAFTFRGNTSDNVIDIKNVTKESGNSPSFLNASGTNCIVKITDFSLVDSGSYTSLFENYDKLTIDIDRLNVNFGATGGGTTTLLGSPSLLSTTPEVKYLGNDILTNAVGSSSNIINYTSIIPLNLYFKCNKVIWNTSTAISIFTLRNGDCYFKINNIESSTFTQELLEFTANSELNVYLDLGNAVIDFPIRSNAANIDGNFYMKIDDLSPSNIVDSRILFNSPSSFDNISIYFNTIFGSIRNRMGGTTTRSLNIIGNEINTFSTTIPSISTFSDEGQHININVNRVITRGIAFDLSYNNASIRSIPIICRVGEIIKNLAANTSPLVNLERGPISFTFGYIEGQNSSAAINMTSSINDANDRQISIQGNKIEMLDPTSTAIIAGGTGVLPQQVIIKVNEINSQGGFIDIGGVTGSASEGPVSIEFNEFTSPVFDTSTPLTPTGISTGIRVRRNNNAVSIRGNTLITSVTGSTALVVRGGSGNNVVDITRIISNSLGVVFATGGTTSTDVFHNLNFTNLNTSGTGITSNLVGGNLIISGNEINSFNDAIGINDSTNPLDVSCKLNIINSTNNCLNQNSSSNVNTKFYVNKALSTGSHAVNINNTSGGTVECLLGGGKFESTATGAINLIGGGSSILLKLDNSTLVSASGASAIVSTVSPTTVHNYGFLTTNTNLGNNPAISLLFPSNIATSSSVI